MQLPLSLPVAFLFASHVVFASLNARTTQIPCNTDAYNACSAEAVNSLGIKSCNWESDPTEFTSIAYTAPACGCSMNSLAYSCGIQNCPGLYSSEVAAESEYLVRYCGGLPAATAAATTEGSGAGFGGATQATLASGPAAATGTGKSNTGSMNAPAPIILGAASFGLFVCCIMGYGPC